MRASAIRWYCTLLAVLAGLLPACTRAQPAPVISFTTEGTAFAPVLVVDGQPEILWVWSDGSTSAEARPRKDFGTPARRTHHLRVKPWSALVRINLGYDAGDGGSGEIEHVPDQHVSAVSGLAVVAPTLRQWCSSYNQLTALDFANFVNLDTLECFLSRSLTTVNLAHTPKLRRACFEDCDLRALDLSQSPALEDLRGAQNAYPGIAFGPTGAHVWHICVRDNPQMAEQTLFADMTPFPNLSEFFIWNDNQAGALRIPATHPDRGVALLADGNHYTSLDLTGSLRQARSSAQVSFRHNQLRSVTLTGCVQLSELYLEANQLPAAQVDGILQTLDALGRSRADGEQVALKVDLRGNARPGPAGLAAAARLAAKGWTVTTETSTLQPAPPPDTGPARIDFVTRGDGTRLRCDFEGAATATWHWSDGTTSTASSGATAVRQGLGQGDHAGWLAISNGAALTRVGAADGGGQGQLVALTGLEQAPRLAVLYAYNEGLLATLGRTQGTRLREYHLLGTALSVERQDQVFDDAVASGVRRGTVWCAHGSAASDADRATLRQREWTVN